MVKGKYNQMKLLPEAGYPFESFLVVPIFTSKKLITSFIEQHAVNFDNFDKIK